jgi:preprotein translocase subunit SecG
MLFFLLVLHVLITAIMIGVILLQKGEDASAGASNSTGMFSARGSKNILTRATAVLAGIFFANCLCMAILVRQEASLSVKSAPKSKKIDKKASDGQ